MTPQAAQPPPPSPIQWGSVGWTDDGGMYVDLGDDSNDGANLVRVTLYAGRSPTDTLDQSQAQGAQLLCRLADGVAIPQRGDKVIVAIPSPWGNIPGGSVIIAKCTSKPRSQANLGPGELVLGVPGGPAQIMIRANGTIVLKTEDASGAITMLKLAPNSFQLNDGAFQLIFDGAGMRLRHAQGCQIRMGGMTGVPSPLNAIASMIRISAGQIKVDAPQVLLGPDLAGAAVYQPIVFSPNPSDPGATPVLMTGVSSTGVKVSIP